MPKIFGIAPLVYMTKDKTSTQLLTTTNFSFIMTNKQIIINHTQLNNKMKKYYITPSIDIKNIECEHILAASPSGDLGAEGKDDVVFESPILKDNNWDKIWD